MGERREEVLQFTAGLALCVTPCHLSCVLFNELLLL